MVLEHDVQIVVACDPLNSDRIKVLIKLLAPPNLPAYIPPDLLALVCAALLCISPAWNVNTTEIVDRSNHMP